MMVTAGALRGRPPRLTGSPGATTVVGPCDLLGYAGRAAVAGPEPIMMATTSVAQGRAGFASVPGSSRTWRYLPAPPSTAVLLFRAFWSHQ
jgi:hypothetical protein